MTTTTDELDVPAGIDLSLREAIRDAAVGDVIDFDTSLSGGTLFLTLGELSVTSANLHIDATALDNGFTIDGGGNSRLFSTSSGIISLSGLTLTGGSTAQNGGAIENSGGAQLTLTDCLILDNEALQSGGGISCNGARLTLIDTRVAHNTATGNGGGVSLVGGVTQVIIAGSTFANNNGGNNGGGIYASGISSFSASASTISGNRTSGSGGGLYLLGNGFSGYNLELCTMAGNLAKNLGGGLLANDDLDLVSSTIARNRAGNGGGGLTLTSTGIRTITNSIVALNSAESADDIQILSGTLTPSGVNYIGSNQGCAAAFPAGVPNGNGDQVGTNTSPLDPNLSPLAFFGGNTETLHPLARSPVIDTGGATILTEDQRGLARVVGAVADIGAVEAGPALFVTTAVDEDDGALGIGDDSLRECLKAAAGTGDRILLIDGSLNNQSFVLTNGPLLVRGKTVFVDASFLDDGISVSGNFATRLLDVVNTSNAAFHSVNFVQGLVNGTASAEGGGIYCAASRISLIDSLLSENGAQGTTASSGGALWLNGFTGTTAAALVGCTLNLNSANSAPSGNSGGAIYSTLASLRATSCTFNSNFASGGAAALNSGGAVDITGGEASFEKCSFENNAVSAQSLGRGGAISSDALTWVERCLFSNNAAARIDPSGNTWGGAIDISGLTTLHTRNTTFTGNTAADDGGAISALGNIKMEHCTVTTNTATDGEGGGVRLGSGTGYFENSLIAANAAGAAAADLYKTAGGTPVDEGGNLLGDNDSVAAEFPAGPLTGTTATPLDPELGLLGDHGGPTLTLPLLASSPARDAAGGNAVSPFIDQRGEARPFGTDPDIGAYEAGNPLGYAVWAAENIPPGLDDGFEEDSEADKNGNGIEYATQLDPTAVEGDAALSAVYDPNALGGPEMQLTFRYRPGAPDLRYRIKRSGTLGTFGVRYTYTSATAAEAFHPSGDVTSFVDTINETITVVDKGIPLPTGFWQLEVVEVP